MKLLLTLLSFFLVTLAPTPTHAQLARREFSTQPAFLFSFDTDPATTINTANGRPQSLNSTFEYTLGAGDHTGLLSLDGTNDFINLRTFFDDNQRVLADATLGGDMSFEVWVTWTQLRQNGRVFDFGGPAAYNDNNIFLSTQGTQSNIMFGMKRNATNSAYTYANSGITLHEWVHIVCTIRQINFTNEADPNAALHSIYLNGVLVTNRTSYLPWVTQRPISWLGRSNWEWNGDSRFRGLIDDFLVYNYSLGAEAVNAHYTVPRVPVFELVFDVDPRVNMNTQSSATYNWVASDAADTPLNQVAHPGLLLLTAAQQQYVTASVLSGTSSVGTQLPTVGGNGWIAADVDTKGWTFEVAIKFTALNANARIFDMGNPSSTAGAAAIDRITLGLSSTGTQLVFEITDSVNGAGGPGASLTVLSSVDVNRWYHIIVVVQPTSSTSSSVARYFAYVDGALTNSLASGVWPRATSRSLAYIGRSTRSTDSYTSALIDSIRVYDYVLEQSEVLALYTSVSKISTVTPAMQSQYRTDPVTSHTFDVSPPWSERNDGTSIGWSSLVAGRAGCLTLNGVNQWVNLYSLPDRNGRRFPSFIGGSSLSLEFWVRFNEFESGSRVFEFTNGDPSGTSDMRDRLVVSNAGASSNMSFVMSAGTAETMRVNVPNVFRELVWTHVVVSFRAQQPYNLTALSDVSIYVNAQLVVSGVARLPPYVSRANNWLGRSRFSNDGYMNGSFDAFHYYNYALESEQVVAHYVLPRPPLFELTFSSNPRVFGANATTLSWSWAAFDQADSAHDRTLHPGVLMLSAAQSQFVDLATGVGSSSVGTVLPYLGQLPTLTDVNRTAAFVGDARARVGMSLEVSFKYDAQASGAFAKVFSCSAANGGDAISLGFTASSTSGSSSNVLALNVSNAEAGRFASQTIVAAMATNTWYHIAVVMSPEALSGSGTDFFATWMIYVNGQLVNTVQRQVFPASNRRPVCYLGRDAQATSGAYLTGAIDVFRVYDYALTTSDVNGVYAAISAYGAVVPSSTGAGGGVVPTAVPRTSSSSVAVAGVVASSSAFVVTPAVSSSGAGGLQPAADASSGDSLTSGSIAGIVIGAIVGVVLLVVMVMLLLRRASHNKKAHSGDVDGHGAGAGAGAHVELSEVNVQDEHESTNDEL